MNRILRNVLASFCLVFFTTSVSAQRYTSEVFTDVTVTSDVAYGSNYSILTGTYVMETLEMDVYQPDGDTLDKRPLIILAHAGSFLPKGANTLPLGVKEDSCMIEMCTQFAKRGWVAASINYRLGWNPTSSDADIRAGTIINAVYRAMQDAKACVRYFKNEATTYKIDSNLITVGGSNSGGYLALAYGSLNDPAELNLLKFRHSVTGALYVDQDSVGGFDGEGGMSGVNNYSNPGSSSDIALVLNLGGAIGDTTWQDAGEVPIISFHGEEDALTPYKTDVVIVAATMQSVVEVSGSHDVSRYATALGNQNFNDGSFTDAYSTTAAARTAHKGLFPFPGAANGFEPWGWYDPNDPNAVGGGGSAANPLANGTKGRLYIDTIMGYFCPRFVEVKKVIDSTVMVGQVEHSVDFSNQVSVFPNPASSHIQINAGVELQSVQMMDMNGRIVKSQQFNGKPVGNLDVNGIESGVYILRLFSEDASAVKRLIIE